MHKTSEILQLILLNNDSMIKVSEYGESKFRNNYSKYPFNSDKCIKIGREFSLDMESTVYTHAGRVWVKFKHSTNDGGVVTWYKTKSKKYTAYAISKKLEVLFV